MPTRPSVDSLTPHDQRDLDSRGIEPASVQWQLDRLRAADRVPRLVRPCGRGDGIRRLTGPERVRYVERYRDVVGNGRVGRFVPASGAGDDLFAPLLVYRDDARRQDLDALRQAAEAGDLAAGELVRFVENAERFAFAGSLRRVLAESPAALRADGRVDRILDAVLGSSRAALAATPVALIPFHHDLDGPRTPLDEHLIETAQLLRCARGTALAHFTIAPGWRPLFQKRLESIRERMRSRYGVELRVTLSEQPASSDSILMREDGQPLRRRDGRLRFRPGGHGTLLANLQSMRTEFAVIRAVEDVAPDSRKVPVYQWTRLLVGHLAEIRDRVAELVRQLEAAPTDRRWIDEALEFTLQVFGSSLPHGFDDQDLEGASRQLRWLLDRPIRVCGMIAGPRRAGGGPFWVEAADGSITRQIVDPEELDPTDATQWDLFRSGGYFNPVSMVCSLDDPHGRRYDLQRFADPNAARVASGMSGGQPWRCVERPGLWNGAMARWNTLFVEMPGETYHRVSSLNELLDPTHQP